MVPPQYSLTQVIPPAAEPLSLADAKLFLRVDHDAEDGVITALVQAARIECEGATGRSFLNQTWEMRLDYLPTSPFWTTTGDPSIRLPRPPLVSIESITYVDQSGNPQVLDPSSYIAIPGDPGRIAPRFGRIFPFAYPQAGSVVIRYVAGYGADASAVPQNIITAVRCLIDFYYQARGADLPTPAYVANLLRPSVWPTYG